jgi:exoribonuclease R
MITYEQLIKDIPTKPTNFFAIARQFKISKDDNKVLTSLLYKGIREKVIFKTKEGFFYKPTVLKQVTGILRVATKGFGFIDVDDSHSAFIRNNNLNGALNGDEVLVDVYKDTFKEESFFGKVNKIVTKNNKYLVGVVNKKDY